MDSKESSSCALWGMDETWASVFEDYGYPVGQLLISFLYSVYKGITVFNVSIFAMKYIPTGFYMYKLVKNIYWSSRDRLKQKRMELEEIQLQIQLMKKQLSARDADFAERAELSKRRTERLRAVRARVRDVIASSATLRQALERVSTWNEDLYLLNGDDIGLRDSNYEGEFKNALLKDWKKDQVVLPDSQTQNKDCEKRSDSNRTENTIYASLNDVDASDCQVKIVKVTNVYKVACLKHYIKQKRMRRATKQAVLQKRIESIKLLLEEWHKSLSRVIEMRNTGLSCQEESQANVRCLSDSDSDARSPVNDEYFDEYNRHSWNQNPYNTYQQFEYDDNLDQESAYESQEYAEKCPHVPNQLCDCVTRTANVLFILPEETSSQLAIEEIKTKTKCSDIDLDCRDVVTV